MSKKTSLTIPEILTLLENPEFCNEAYIVNQKIAELNLSLSLEELGAGLFDQQAEFPKSFEEQFREIVEPFIKRWGVTPPPPSAFLDTDLKRDQGLAIMSGLWGVIPVFPWTRADVAPAEVHRIKESISTRHVNAMEDRKKKGISSWLSSLGFSNKEIARDFLERETGLERPTKEEAIASLDFEEEHALLRQFKQYFLEQGLDEAVARKKAESAVHRKLRGSEAPAQDAVRHAIKRFRDDREAHVKALMAPAQLDPISYPITMLIQTYKSQPENNEEIKRWIEALLDALRHYPTRT